MHFTLTQFFGIETKTENVMKNIYKKIMIKPLIEAG